MATDPEEHLLRAKYLDWCSARIAERFLELTPEEIYELAHDASFEIIEEGVAASLSSNLGAFVAAGRGAPGRAGAEPAASERGASPAGAAPTDEPASGSARTDESASGADDPAAEPAAEAAGGTAEGGAARSYRALVERVTEALMERMELPSFDDWLAVYRTDPDRYEEELLGFWTEWS